ncbi:MAG: YeeE/YedE family protein [Burkholderiaceae bacterium]|nr:MAG: YeeE/YedE family protein [Burkholderiaceae bacterium]
MASADFHALVTSTLAIAFAISALFGAVARHTHFCTMGAISDAVALGDWLRMRQWAMAVGVAMCGFAVLVAMGWVDPAQTLYASTSVLWLSALVGGALFGFGMVIASGCGSKNLIRLGGGSLKSLVVFVVMGLAAFATLKGITAVLRVLTVDAVQWPLQRQAFLPDALARWSGLPVHALPTLRLGTGLLLGGLLIAWAVAGGRRDARSLLGGTGIGALVVAAWWLSGHWAEVQEHPQTLEHMYAATYTGRIEALSFAAPLAHTLDWLLFFSDRNKVLTVGVVSVLGVIAGAAAHALYTREFRWQGFANTDDLAHHLTGAALMGVGGVTAMGCTIGQGLSAISTLHLASFPAVLAIIGGAVVALRYQNWRIERSVS